MNLPHNGYLRRSWRTLFLAVIVLAAIAFVWLLGDHTLIGLGLATLSVGGAGLVAWFSTRRPAVAFGILFLLASLSRWTIDTRLGNMRLEQPAIAAGLLVLLYARRLPDRATLRRLVPIAIAFMIYLGALAVSSVLHSPDRADSLRMTFWIALSMAGGLLAFVLLFGSDSEGGTGWLRLAAAGQATVGLLVALLFFTLGPVVFAGVDPVPGMQDVFAAGPKVFAMSWEANVYASLLSALTPFAIERFRSRPQVRSAAVLVLILFGLAVGVTRGAYIGLAAGVSIYGLVILYRKERPRSLLIPAAVVVGAIVGGAFAASILLPVNRTPNEPLDLTVAGWGRGYAIGSYTLPGLAVSDLPTIVGSGGSGGSGGSTTPVKPPAIKNGQPIVPDTIGFRLDRIPMALKDLPRDPVIGLGANTFGQRHADASQGGAPDHIAILALAALYESGIVGVAGLTIGFVLILLALWRASEHPGMAPMAAAYLGALVCLLVAYQATNAINFAQIWLFAGAGLAFASRATPETRSATD